MPKKVKEIKKAVGESLRKEQLTPLQKWENAVRNIKTGIKKLEDRSFRFYFFVFDTKGTPNGSLSYEYETAFQLKELGYDVRMLHSEEEFMGVEGWLGEKYAKLPHYNVEKDGVNIGPSDFLIIPELFTNVMYKTMNLSCKRIALLQNYGYMLDVIQPGATWQKYGINDCITITNTLKERMESLFPTMKVEVVKPSLNEVFNDDGEPKKLFVNIISKYSRDSNKVVKEFFWKYPAYQWVPFRELKNLTREELADALKESFLTVWLDEDTNFGYCALEAMKAGSVVIGKIPTDRPDWCKDLTNNAIWFESIDDVHDIIAQAIDAFLDDSMPQVLYDEMANTQKEYSEESFVKSIMDIYIHKYVDDRKEELKKTLKIAEQKVEDLKNGKEEKTGEA